MEHKDQEFLAYIVDSIVNDKNAVKIERSTDEMGVLLTLHVGKEDMGQIVGRQGATANAIRSLLRIVGLKNGSRASLKIVEPEL